MMSESHLQIIVNHVLPTKAHTQINSLYLKYGLGCVHPVGRNSV